MIRRIPPVDPSAPALLIDLGNTTTRMGTWHQGTVKTPLLCPTRDETAFDEACAAHIESMPHKRPAAVIVASVVPDALDRLRRHLEERLESSPLVVGDTVPLPMDVAVTDPRALGVDRVCAAAAAFDQLQTACIVVDFGTAVTVDLTDDEGVFRGGAILPGLRLQLKALHEHTAVLPLVDPAMPELPYGRNTTEAMQCGAIRGLAGAVRGLVEGYATHLNRWPQVVATGGDLALMAPACDFLDTLVENLVLRGVGVAYRQHLEAHGL